MERSQTRKGGKRREAKGGSLPPSEEVDAAGNGSAGCSQNDVSFMDTEPMDVSMLNTEPMDQDLNGAEEVASDDSTSPSGSDSGDNEPVQTEKRRKFREVNYTSSQYDSEYERPPSPSFFSDDSLVDSEEEGATPPPPHVNIEVTPSHEVRRIYNELIESCRGFQEESFNETSDRLMSNINEGGRLFRQMDVSFSNSYNETPNVARSRNGLGSSASELHLACQHTKVCASLIKQSAVTFGAASCSFKLDDFLESLKKMCPDKTGDYSLLLTVRRLAYTAATVSYSVPHFHTMSGCLEKDNFVQVIAPTPKEAKVRVQRRKDEIKVEDATQKEVMNVKTEDRVDDVKAGTPEGLAKDLIKTLKNKYKEKQSPQNLLEVARSNSVPEIVSRMFGIAFLARDGHVGISQADGENLDATTALMLTPEKPPEKKVGGREDKKRQQYIASFSSKFLKALVKPSSNETG